MLPSAPGSRQLDATRRARDGAEPKTPTIAPDHVSEYPNACANVGDSVLTGRTPRKPTHITITSDIASWARAARSAPKLSRSDARGRERPAACGLTSSRRAQRQVRQRVERERPGDPERRDDRRRDDRPDRPRQVERHRVERDALRTSLASTSAVITPALRRPGSRARAPRRGRGRRRRRPRAAVIPRRQAAASTLPPRDRESTSPARRGRPSRTRRE